MTENLEYPSLKTANRSLPLTLFHQQIAAEFQTRSTLKCEMLALFWHAMLLASWGAFASGWLPLAGFFLVGTCAFIRNFNAQHQFMHAHGLRRSFLTSLHLLLNIVASPLQLSYDEAAHNHHLHHRFPRNLERDPHAHINNGPWWSALLYAAIQPEHSLVRWLQQHGWSWRIVWVLLWNSTVLGVLLAFGGLYSLLAWLVLTRLNTTFSWFIFDWVLHHNHFWGRVYPIAIPKVIIPVWIVLFGYDNFYGVQYHTLHHSYPYVRDIDLPRLSSSYWDLNKK